LRKVLKLLSIAVLFGLLLLFVSNIWIVLSTKSQVFNSIEIIPENEVGLVLGTSSKTMAGVDNQYFVTRIEQAAALFKSGKIRRILVSGDNETVYYNEPMKMKEALIKAGVPESAITLDFAGYRTLDSIVRCKEVFGIAAVTIITQEFHSYRALFIGNHNGLNAIALTAGPAEHQDSYSVLAREYFARLKAVLDLYVLNTTPKHLDQKEEMSL